MECTLILPVCGALLDSRFLDQSDVISHHCVPLARSDPTSGLTVLICIRMSTSSSAYTLFGARTILWWIEILGEGQGLKLLGRRSDPTEVWHTVR